MTYETIQETQVDYCPQINCPADVAKALAPYRNLKQEYFLVLLLDTKNHVKAIKISTIGLVNQCLVHPRETFCHAIEAHCTAIIIAHNHPSGGTQPSKEDEETTERIKKAGEILGITMLDHVIITKDSYYSCVQQV